MTVYRCRENENLLFFKDLEFLVSHVFIQPEKQSQIICRICADWNKKLAKKSCKIWRKFVTMYVLNRQLPVKIKSKDQHLRLRDML